LRELVVYGKKFNISVLAPIFGLMKDQEFAKRFLDKVYGHISDPFKQWSLKRDSLKRMVEKIKPDYYKSDLDLVYNQFGLPDESNPINKHYVRCMHD
tara:strand:+ start:827 stop:1117 length:291 start_codon:yes stop_codon:yes gene_type:complete